MIHSPGKIFPPKKKKKKQNIKTDVTFLRSRAPPKLPKAFYLKQDTRGGVATKMTSFISRPGASPPPSFIKRYIKMTQGSDSFKNDYWTAGRKRDTCRNYSSLERGCRSSSGQLLSVRSTTLPPLPPHHKPQITVVAY